MERSEDCSIIMLGPKLFIIYLKHFNLLPYYIGLLKCNHENETTFKIVYIHSFEIITKKNTICKNLILQMCIQYT